MRYLQLLLYCLAAVSLCLSSPNNKCSPPTCNNSPSEAAMHQSHDTKYTVTATDKTSLEPITTLRRRSLYRSPQIHPDLKSTLRKHLDFYAHRKIRVAEIPRWRQRTLRIALTEDIKKYGSLRAALLAERNGYWHWIDPRSPVMGVPDTVKIPDDNKLLKSMREYIANGGEPRSEMKPFTKQNKLEIPKKNDPLKMPAELQDLPPPEVWPPRTPVSYEEVAAALVLEDVEHPDLVYPFAPLPHTRGRWQNFRDAQRGKLLRSPGRYHSTYWGPAHEFYPNMFLANNKQYGVFEADIYLLNERLRGKAANMPDASLKNLRFVLDSDPKALTTRYVSIPEAGIRFHTSYTFKPTQWLDSTKAYVIHELIKGKGEHGLGFTISKEPEAIIQNTYKKAFPRKLDRWPLPPGYVNKRGSNWADASFTPDRPAPADHQQIGKRPIYEPMDYSPSTWYKHPELEGIRYFGPRKGFQQDLWFESKEGSWIARGNPNALPTSLEGNPIYKPYLIEGVSQRQDAAKGRIGEKIVKINNLETALEMNGMKFQRPAPWMLLGEEEMEWPYTTVFGYYKVKPTPGRALLGKFVTRRLRDKYHLYNFRPVKSAPHIVYNNPGGPEDALWYQKVAETKYGKLPARWRQEIPMSRFVEQQYAHMEWLQKQGSPVPDKWKSKAVAKDVQQATRDYWRGGKEPTGIKDPTFEQNRFFIETHGTTDLDRVPQNERLTQEEIYRRVDKYFKAGGKLPKKQGNTELASAPKKGILKTPEAAKGESGPANPLDAQPGKEFEAPRDAVAADALVDSTPSRKLRHPADEFPSGLDGTSNTKPRPVDKSASGRTGSRVPQDIGPYLDGSAVTDPKADVAGYGEKAMHRIRQLLAGPKTGDAVGRFQPAVPAAAEDAKPGELIKPEGPVEPRPPLKAELPELPLRLRFPYKHPIGLTPATDWLRVAAIERWGPRPVVHESRPVDDNLPSNSLGSETSSFVSETTRSDSALASAIGRAFSRAAMEGVVKDAWKVGRTVGLLILKELLGRGTLAPFLAVVDVVATAQMIFDIISLAVPYHQGKCIKEKNLCVSDLDLSLHQCGSLNPCRTDGDACGYRTVEPDKVVCDWDDYHTWTMATHHGGTSILVRELLVKKHRNEVTTKFTQLQELDRDWASHECDKAPTAKDCQVLNATITIKLRQLDEHAQHTNLYKSPTHRKKATHLWDKAEAFALTAVQPLQKKLAQLEADKTELSTRTIRHKKHALHDLDKEIKLKTDMLDKEVKKLGHIAKKAHKAAVKADPLAFRPPANCTSDCEQQIQTFYNQILNGTFAEHEKGNEVWKNGKQEEKKKTHH